MNVNYALIGTGRIAKEHISGIKATSNAKLWGVYSRDIKRAEEMGKKYNIKAYSTLNELLDDKNITAVDIVTVNNLHKEIAIQAAKKGKHIILEKPLAIHDQEAEEILKTCKENNVQITVISNYRNSPFFKNLKEKIDQGKFGKIILAQVSINKSRKPDYFKSWQGKKQEAGGGVLIMNVIHMLDLVLYLLGDVEKVSCSLNYNQKEVEESCAATLTFKNQALCAINATTAANVNYPDSIEIVGTKGSVAVSGTSIKRYAFSNNQLKAMLFSKLNTFRRINHGRIKAQIQDFTEAIIQKRQPAIRGEDAKKTLSLINKLYKSAELGQEIKVDET